MSIPAVRTSEGFIEPWSREKIVAMIVKETKLCKQFFGVEPATEEEAQRIACDVEKAIRGMGLSFLSGPLIREVTNNVLLEAGHLEWRNIMTRVGASVYDAYEIDSGYGFGANDNANQLNNAETSHKRKADKMSKEQNLLLLPKTLSELHLNGDFHIHDLEYMGTRPFCIPDSEIMLVRRNNNVYMDFPSKCLSGDEVYTPNGWRPIKFRTQREYKGKMLTFSTLCGGYVTVTPEHRICVLEKGQYVNKMAKDIVVGDVLPTPDIKVSPGEHEITDTTALYLGSFVANGHARFTQDNGNSYYVVVSDEGETTKEIVMNFAKERNYHVCVSEVEGKVPQYIITRKELYQDICSNHGICKGAVNKNLPADILNMPLKTQRLIIGGLFNGDGCLYYHKEKSTLNADYKTVSKTLMQQLSMWLKINGVGHTVKCVPPITSEGGITGNHDMYIISLQRAGIENITFIGKQKETLESFNKNVKCTKRKDHLNIVKSIKATEFSGIVYDFGLADSVEDKDHLFLAGSGVYIHNCQDWDLRYFFYYGLMPDGVGGQSSVAKPAKNAEVAFLHAVKAMGSAQTNFAGGQGFYNFLTFVAPYLEGKTYIEIKQLMQLFVYEMMQMMCARGGQTVFSSVQLSPGVPAMWRSLPIVAKGKIWDGNQAPLRTYGELEKEVRLGFKAMMEVMIEGDAWGKPFSFPKPEISIEPDFMQEDRKFNIEHPDIPTYEELYTLACALAAKFGTPYFDNQLPEYRGAGEGISCYQCCAYQFSANPKDDKDFNDKLYFRNGRHFSMGSWMVLSLNCPRAAYKAEHNDTFLIVELKQLMDRAVEVFKIKRAWMDQLIQNNRVPFASQKPIDPNTGEVGAIAVDFESLVYTIGVVGINEMVQYHTGYQMHESPVAYKLAIRVMFELKQYAHELSEKHGMEIALARTPAETTAQRFAVSDLLHNEYFSSAVTVVKGDTEKTLNMLGKTKDLPVYYTNGTHISPGANISLPERIKYEHTFFPIVDGGNILHIWLGEAYSDPKGLYAFMLSICKNTQVGYFAFTKDFTVCLKEGRVVGGLVDHCPYCNSDNVQHMSRITGYLQSVDGWNEGKKQELKDRMRYNI